MHQLLLPLKITSGEHNRKEKQLMLRASATQRPSLHLMERRKKTLKKRTHKIAVWLKVRAVINDRSSRRTISNRILIVQQAAAAG